MKSQLVLPADATQLAIELDRELQFAPGMRVQRLTEAAFLAGDTVALWCDLPEEMMGGEAASATTAVTEAEELFGLSYSDAVTAARRLIVIRALEQAGGHQTRAAERLGVTQPYLSRLIKQLGIRRDDT